MAPLTGKVCLVTGATRGLGRGVALQLGEAGATVYITGRTQKPKPGSVGGSLEETAKEIEARGGKCISVVCDHSKDEEIEALFKRIDKEQNGQLDILVNNAYSGVREIVLNLGVPFWELDLNMWDLLNNVGLRNHYMCTIYAARMMVSRKQGLIVNISSPGGLRYLFNVPYGIGKQAVDRMAVDCASELRKYNVAMVSMWPIGVQTEVINDTMFSSRFEQGYNDPAMGDIQSGQLQEAFKDGESAEFVGKAIVHLYQDRNLMTKSGRVLLTSELASEYGYTDIDGHVVPSIRSVKYLLRTRGWRKLAEYVPAWIKIPYFLLTVSGSKF